MPGSSGAAPPSASDERLRGASARTGEAMSAYMLVETSKASLAVVDTPAAESDSAAPPLVLVHGFTGHRDDWIGVAPALARHRRVIAFDLRGHGDSKPTEANPSFSFEELVLDLGELVDALEIDRFSLLGHSVGGMIALRFALAQPQRLASLILMDTAPEVPPLLSREAFAKASEIAAARGLPFLQSLSERVGRKRPDQTIEVWQERYWRHNRRRLGAMTPESYAGVGGALFASETQVPRLGEIDVPTLILVGDGDREFEDGAELFARHIPDAKMVRIEAAGHHPQQENPEAWLRAMFEFLD